MSTLIIHTDGGARGNPGPAAAGVVVFHDSQVIAQAGKYLGNQTNNEAEYQAVLLALTLLPELLATHHPHQVIWKLDSMLVVQQLNRGWKIKEDRLRQLAQQIWQQLAQHQTPSTFTYVPRAQNAVADAVVNQTLDAQAAVK